MSLHTALDTALYQRLTTTAGTALWGQRVYTGQAPQGATLPYVVFNVVSGGDLALSRSRLVDVRYRAVCIALSAAEARDGGDHLDAALHEQPLTIAGWTHLGTTQHTLISRVETLEGRQYWGRGGVYRVRAAG
jgi:hypothetical protein